MSLGVPVTRPFVPRFRLRLFAAGVLAACLVGSLAACGAGNNATTRHFYSPSDGVSAVVGTMRVLNALVVAPPQGGSGAVLTMLVANDGPAPEHITGISTDRFGPVQLSGP